MTATMAAGPPEATERLGPQPLNPLAAGGPVVVGVDGTARSVDLYWLPLGAGDGSHLVRWSGRRYEAIAARRQRRARCDLYHSALEVRLGVDRFTIEMAPVWSIREPDRGVVAEGPVGLAWLGRSPLFRYEVRRWRNGRIPDLAEAVGSPQRMATDAERTRRLLDLVPDVPTVTWGRDELRTGDMWNCNSLVSWLLHRSGHDAGAAAPPPHGRAPGWSAGLVVAARQLGAPASLVPAPADLGQVNVEAPPEALSQPRSPATRRAR